MERHERLIGVLPTYRRSDLLRSTLGRLGEQTRVPDVIIVVDNEGSANTEAVVASASVPGCRMEYVSPGTNLGFAGGVAAGMRRALEFADDDDWIMLFDDDDPPRFSTSIATIAEFGRTMRARDPTTAAVGISGGWFDWRRGRIQRIPDRDLVGAVEVDHVAGGHLACFLVGTVRRMGVFCDELFFGFSELEYGLRLWRAGHALYAHGTLWLEGRTRTDRLNLVLRPSRRLGMVTWRNYYSLRNAIFILRRFHRPGTAVRVTLVQGLAKPIVNLPLSPVRAVQHLHTNLRAIGHGWTGRMGRRVDPDGGVRTGKAKERALTLGGSA